MEGIGQSIRGHLPALSQIWNHLSVMVKAREAIENEATQVIIDLAGLTKQGVDKLRRASKSFDVRSPSTGHPFGGKVECYKGQQCDEQPDPDEDQQDLPANMFDQRNLGLWKTGQPEYTTLMIETRKNNRAASAAANNNNLGFHVFGV